MGEAGLHRAARRADHSGLRPDFDAFADIAQVIYLDHRDNGRSVPSDPATWTLAQWGDDIRQFCDALGIAKPIMLGQSFGGMVAQSYAARHPEHPRALDPFQHGGADGLSVQPELVWRSIGIFRCRGGKSMRWISAPLSKRCHVRRWCWRAQSDQAAASCERKIAACVGDRRVGLHIYERCGHGAFRDEPELVFAAIRAFVAGL